VENLALSQRRKAQRTALTLACVIGFVFSANYTNHAPLVGALAREFDFNRTFAGLLTTGIFTTYAMLQVPVGHLADKLRQSEWLTCRASDDFARLSGGWPPGGFKRQLSAELPRASGLFGCGMHCGPFPFPE